MPAGSQTDRNVPDHESRLFRGWIVVAGAFIVVMVGFGALYGTAAFSEALAAEYGAPRNVVTMIFPLSGAACFIVSAVSGPLADRVGPRMLSVVGMALVGAGLALSAQAETLTELFVLQALLVGIGTGIAYVPAAGAVQRWFFRRRGLASGLAACGIGIGTLVVPLLADGLIETAGWRDAFETLGLLAAVIGIGGALLLDASPERYGLHPDGASMPPAHGRAMMGATLGQALRHPDFWRLYACAALVSGAMALPFAHLVASGRDLGLSQTEAVSLICLIGTGSIVGRVTLGLLADVLGRQAVFVLCCGGIGVTSLVWWSATGPVALSAFALSFGALNGGFVAVLPAFVADRFGTRSASGILGMVHTGRGLATLLGPALAGAAFDRLGGYGIAVLMGGACCVAGAMMVARVGAKRRLRHPVAARTSAQPALCGTVLRRTAVRRAVVGRTASVVYRPGVTV